MVYGFRREYISFKYYRYSRDSDETKSGYADCERDTQRPREARWIQRANEAHVSQLKDPQPLSKVPRFE